MRRGLRQIKYPFTTVFKDMSHCASLEAKWLLSGARFQPRQRVLTDDELCGRQTPPIFAAIRNTRAGRRRVHQRQSASGEERRPEADARNDPTESRLAAVASASSQRFQVAFHQLHDEFVVAGVPLEA